MFGISSLMNCHLEGYQLGVLSLLTAFPDDPFSRNSQLEDEMLIMQVAEVDVHAYMNTNKYSIT